MYITESPAIYLPPSFNTYFVSVYIVCVCDLLNYFKFQVSSLAEISIIITILPIWCGYGFICDVN